MQFLIDTTSSVLPIAALPGHGFNVIDSFLRAGPMARIVLSILAVLSIVSWWILLQKLAQYRKVERQNNEFLDVFRSSGGFREIQGAAQRFDAAPLGALFQAGYVEIDSQIKSGGSQQTESSQSARLRIRSLDSIERTLRRASNVELRSLSSNAQWLATTAAAAPFIGLLGTVWGIMMAFNDIGATGSASIVTVAPGIAESLINTAAGLIAAIPALVGYNQLASRLKTIRAAMDDFTLEFLNLADSNFG